MPTARSIPFLALALTCLFAVGASAAQAAPSNDNFGNARYLGYGDVDATIDTTGATWEVGETLTPGGAGDRTACNIGSDSFQSYATAWWYVYGSGRPVTVSTSGSAFDTLLGIFDGGVNDDSVVCTDDIGGGDRGSRWTFDTVAGYPYRFQVGGCTKYNGAQYAVCSANWFGPVRIVATTPAVANDARGSAVALSTGVRVSSDNYGATEEAGETLSCGSEPYGRTVWYRWTAPAAGSAIFSSTGIHTILSVYRADSGARVGCGLHDPSGATRVGVAVTPGDYLLQIGGHGTHSMPASESVMGSLTALAEFSENTDRDGDHVTNAADCRPDDPKIPTKEIPMNGIDEDCNGKDAPYPKLSSSTRGKATWLFYRSYTVLTDLRALKVPKGSTVQVRCSGASCPARKLVTRKVRKARKALDLRTSKVRRLKLRPVTTIQVRITRPRHVGRVKTWRFSRLGKDPQEIDRCLAVGSKKPVRCGSLPG
jgi:hypothetical protein